MHTQVWVYEEADAETEDNLYVHHDVIVPYFPLSVAWLDMDPAGARMGIHLRLGLGLGRDRSGAED